jgi:hypothetical protein
VASIERTRACPRAPIEPQSIVATRHRGLANRVRRFAQKAGFGERG